MSVMQQTKIISKGNGQERDHAVFVKLNPAVPADIRIYNDVSEQRKDINLHIEGWNSAEHLRSSSTLYADTYYGGRSGKEGAFNEVTLIGVRINERGSPTSLSGPQAGARTYVVSFKTTKADGQQETASTALIYEQKKGSGCPEELVNEALETMLNEGPDAARYLVTEGASKLYGFEYEPTSEESRLRAKEAFIARVTAIVEYQGVREAVKFLLAEGSSIRMFG